MNPAADQLLFETRATGGVALGIFTKLATPFGRDTAEEGANCGRFFHGIVSAVDAGCGPWALSYSADGVFVFLAVSDAGRAAAEIISAFRRFGSESTGALIQQQVNGSWRSVFPQPGAPFILPEEILLPPKEYFDLLDKIAANRAQLAALAARAARHEALSYEIAQIKARLAKLESDRRIDLISDTEAENLLGSIGERMEAIAVEIALKGES